MNKVSLYLILSSIVIILGATLRLYHFTYSAPFDWDQNRDYQEIAKIAQGKFTLIGPVAKGEGGFFLGPLYYYLVVPLYSVLSGSPLSLPLTSILLDILALIAILALYPSRIGKIPTLAGAFIWSISWFAIQAARISWNVALVPLWIVLFLYALSAKNKLRVIDLGLLGLLSGVAWHVHASLIPLALFLSIWRWRDIASFWHLGSYFAGYLLAISPLVLFDLRHSGMERYLMLQYLEGSQRVVAQWPMVVDSVLGRMGKNIYSLMFGVSTLHPFWGIGSLLLALIGLFRRERFYQVASSLVLLNLGLTLMLREPGFPEYYLLPAMLPLIFACVGLLTYIRPLRLLAPAIICLIILVANLKTYSSAPSPFSLYQKIAIAKKVVENNEPISFQTDLPFGRDSGMNALIHAYGGKQQGAPVTSYLLTDKTDVSVFAEGELYQDVGWYGGFRLAKRKLQ